MRAKLSKIIISLLLLFLTIKPGFSQNNSAIQYYNLGVGYHNKGQLELAAQNYKKSLSINPKLADARYNLIVTYFNLAYKYNKQGKSDLAIRNYKNLLALDPKNSGAYYNLGIIYNNLGQDELAIQSYKKALEINPKYDNARYNLGVIYYNDGITHQNRNEYDLAIEDFKKAISMDSKYANAYGAMANAYTEKGEYDLAIQNYRKTLELDPDSTYVEHNIKIALEKKEEEELSKRINTVKATNTASRELYKLVKPDSGVRESSVCMLYEVLDLIWADPEGRKLLTIIKNNNIPIKITRGSEDTNAHIQTKEYRQTVTYAGIPLFTVNTYSEKNIMVNVGEDHVRAFRDSNLAVDTRIYALQVFMHEFCHAAKNTLQGSSKNALEEELSSTMIGYNIASRIIKGRNLTAEEAQDYSKRCMKSLLKDDHRLLPIYNDFNYKIQELGIYPPHLGEYQDIVELYQSIRNDPEVRKLDTIERMLYSR